MTTYWQKGLLFTSLMVIAFLTGMVIGDMLGFTAGQKYVSALIGLKMKKEISTGRQFSVKQIDGIVFYPRKDMGVNYAASDKNKGEVR